MTMEIPGDIPVVRRINVQKSFKKKICPACKGQRFLPKLFTGRTLPAYACNTCNGEGSVPVEDTIPGTLVFTIPSTKHGDCRPRIVIWNVWKYRNENNL
jgi:uncharacterized protein (DUF983 family)